MINSESISPTQSNSWPVSTKYVSMAGDQLEKQPDQFNEKQQFLQLAMERFKLANDAEAQMREEMLLDWQFRAGDQWDPMIRIARERGQFARPCLTINRMPGFIDHVVNNMRQSRPQVKVAPVGDSDEEQAQIRQGLMRHIAVNSQADTAYDTSMEQMATGGLAWMRVIDDWAAPDSFDQELFIRPIENPFTVYSDPTRTKLDWSDAKYRFIVADLTPQEFIAQFGDKVLAASLENFKSIGDHAQYWMPGQNIRVAEYYWIELEKDRLLQLSDGRTVLYSKLEDIFPQTKGELPDGINIIQHREVNSPVVWWALITALDILKKRKWGGSLIPVIPVIGKQYELDGERRVHGMVRDAREPQRMYNYMYSTLVETVALAPRNQFIVEVNTLAEFRDAYERANTDPMAALPYKATVVTGEGGQQSFLVPPPQRQSAAVEVQSYIAGITLADQLMKSVFSIYDASLGQKGPQESGIAINARKIESDTGTYNWGDNFLRALQFVWRVVNELLPIYYNTPGRVAQIIRDDESQEPVTLNQRYADKNGIERFYNLSDGKYGVVITTGPSFATRRQEAASSMLEIVKVYPQLMQAAGPQIIKEMDWPGKDAIAAQLEKIMPPALRTQTPGDQPDIGQLQTQNAEMQSAIQQLTQALHQATDKNETAKMKEEFATLRTMITAQSNLIVEQMKVGSTEAQLLSDRTFQEAERLQQAILPETQTGQPEATPGQNQPQPAGQ